MQKIVHLTSAHPPFDIRIFTKQCRTLAQNGYDVSLVAPHTCDEVVDGVQIRAVPMASGRLARALVTTVRVARRALAEDADLYHLHDPELLPVGRWLQRRGYKVVFDMHENLPKAILNKQYLPKMLRRPIGKTVSLFERWALAKMPVVFAERSYQDDYLWIDRYRVLLNLPIIDEIPFVDARSTVPTVGYIGTIHPLRGSHVVVEALAQLKDSGTSVGCEYVGPVSKEHEKELTDLATHAGLEHLTLHGYLPAKSGWDIMARCHIGLAVLKPIPNFIGSFPTKLFEYMAMGIPVVVSNFPLYREIVEPVGCGICVDPENTTEVADAIGWLTRNSEEAARMGQRGRQCVVEKYSWEAEHSNLLDFYDELFEHERETLGDTHPLPVEVELREAA